MTDTDRQDNVYGENHPAGEDANPGEGGIREETTQSDPNKTGVAEELDQARDRSSTGTGGMGRVETPRDGESQGVWEKAEENG